jgi:hypothetical protein
MSTSTGSTGTRILEAWAELEKALRAALPVCSVQPPTQPSELLSALRINHQIGPEDEATVLALRETRNRVAHSPEEPSQEEALRFERDVRIITERLRGPGTIPC